MPSVLAINWGGNLLLFSKKNLQTSPNFSKFLQFLENLWRSWRNVLKFRNYYYIEKYISSTCSIFSKRGSVKVRSVQCL